MKKLRPSTQSSYNRLLSSIDAVDSIPNNLSERLLALTPNTRRATIIALRSVHGLTLPIPKAIPRRYELPDEDTLRMALMLSKYEARGMLMMYAGLRAGEACAITYTKLSGNRLTIDSQILQHDGMIYEAPPKTSQSDVRVPSFLLPIIGSLTSIDKPANVRMDLRRAGKRMGISLNPHMLRHWYATELLKRTNNIALVSRQLRHSDIATTLRTYVQVDDDDIEDVFGG